MKNNYKTIISKLYELPGNFYIEIREEQGYTDFYLLNSDFSYISCIFKVKTEVLTKNLDKLVLNLFVENFIIYLNDIGNGYGVAFDLFEELSGTRIETIKRDIKRRIREKDFVIPTERAVLVYKLSSTYTVEVADHLKTTGAFSFILTHKNHPKFKINAGGTTCECIERMFNNDIIQCIEACKLGLKDEYREYLKDHDIIL